MANEEVAAQRPSVRRLMIMSMTLKNFKSYAGEQQIGPFHKKFSAIVGPNGSGKSNVIDAMLFVFGHKARKIRLDKISSLIHKSDAHPNLREGRVTVYFQDIIDYEDSDTDFDPVPGTEMSVCRSCNQDGQSHYYINGQKSTYREVTSLLREKKGIDLDHNRFLILQGEVEQISLMKPKAMSDNEDGLLEYIEDIVGTQHYKEAIHEGAELVEKLSEERETHVNRVQTAEKDRDCLEGEKLTAEEFLKLEVKLKKEQAVYIQKKQKELTPQIEAKQEEVDAADKKLRADGKGLKETVKEVAQLDAEIKATGKELDAANEAFGKRQAEWRKIDTGSAEHESNVKHAKTAHERQTNTHKKAVAELTKTEKQISTAEAEVAEGEKEAAKLQRIIDNDTASLEKQTESLQQQLKPLRERRERMQKEMLPFNEKVNEAEEKLKLCENERRMHRSMNGDIKERVEAEQRRRAETDSKVHKLQETLKGNKKKLKAMEEQNKKDVDQLQKAERALPEVRAKSQELLSKVELLKKQAQEAGTESAVARAVKRLKAQGGLDGYYGRLGDLGRIDDKYGIAVSTAAGATLNCLLVDRESTGAKILQYLKENNTGRAQIMLLDHQTKQFGSAVQKKPARTPGGLPRLFDLIECPDLFAPAFYSATRETLVAKNMTEAVEVDRDHASKGRRLRVVTEGGELIEPTGTMSGGGRKKQSSAGGMRSFQVSSSLKEDLMKYQQCLEQVVCDERSLVDTIHKLRDEAATSTRKLKEYQELVAREERDLAHAEQQLKDIDTALALLEKEGAAHEAEQKKDVEKLKMLDTKCEGAAKELDQARFDKKDLDDNIALLQREIDGIGGPDYIKLQQVLKDNKGHLAKLEQKITEAKATAAASHKLLDSRRNKATATERELQKAKERLEELKQCSAKDDTELMKAEEEMNDTRQDVEEIRRKLTDLQKKREKKKGLLNKSKAEEVKLQNALEKVSEELAVLKRKTAKLSESLHNMDLKLQETIVEYGTTILTTEDVGDDPSAFDPQSFTVVIKDPEELARRDTKTVMHNIQRYEEMQKKLKPNVKALAEWREKNKVYLKRAQDLKEVSDKRAAAQAEVDSLRKKRHDEFMAGFKAITYKLKEMYQMLTMGGDAELELVDTFDPFTEGLQFAVRPPKKSWKHISNLSGGEKTLSSLALVFALHHFKPTPFYVMDEIDAALDFKNVSIVANYIKSAASNAQFIIISLRNNMFELANRLIGICKTENCTKSAAINPACFATLLPGSTPAEVVAVRQPAEPVKRGPEKEAEGSPLSKKQCGGQAAPPSQAS